MTDTDRGDAFTPTEDNEDVVIADKPVAEEKEDDEAKAPLDKALPEDKKDKQPEPRIPLSRHKQLLETERGRTHALESQLAEALKAGNKDQQSANLSAANEAIDKLEERFMQQMLDGDADDAKKTRLEIRTLEQDLARKERAVDIAASELRAVERVRYDVVVERLEAAYPQINPDHDDYDAAAVKEVLELKAAFELQNYPSSTALQRAVKYVFAATTSAQERATSVVARADGQKTTADERKEAAIARALDAAGKTPPNIAKIGLASDKAGGGALDAKSVLKMSQKDFASLGEEQLSRLRGDTL